MAKETKLFSVQVKLNDRDFDDVFRIYMEYERGNEKKGGLITSAVLCAVCIAVAVVLHRLMFVFYGVACLIVGFSYFMVRVNRKFIATNKLQFGQRRETCFYPHHITTMELLEDEEAEDLDEDELADAVTKISTMTVTAYESNRGFLFAEGKIVNQFLYLPKRGMHPTEIEDIRSFAENKCSGGYHLLETKSMLDDDRDEAEEDDSFSMTDEVCERYYGAGKLRIHDESGNRVHPENEEEPGGPDTDE